MYLQPLGVDLNQVQQVLRKVLKDQVDLTLLLKRLPDSHHMIALEHLEHLDLPLDRALVVFVFIGLLELLYRNCNNL